MQKPLTLLHVATRPTLTNVQNRCVIPLIASWWNLETHARNRKKLESAKRRALPSLVERVFTQASRLETDPKRKMRWSKLKSRNGKFVPLSVYVSFFGISSYLCTAGPRHNSLYGTEYFKLSMYVQTWWMIPVARAYLWSPVHLIVGWHIWTFLWLMCLFAYVLFLLQLYTTAKTTTTDYILSVYRPIKRLEAKKEIMKKEKSLRGSEEKREREKKRKSTLIMADTSSDSV